ncbi:oxidoreductase [Methyloligella sp. 2.7D]|uniref:oxidoreductase n=1 Tax=unclassified Methyloligella TaxID=2625955 RepID=UPI00157D6394|nr:oxidoreductase [Methyloligella sp. GL2]QKP76244.1 oxidoreductase [Methyloligella sp. GL2]
MSESKVFFITGVSSGLGKAFAEAALAAGHKVAGTLRNADAASAFSADPTGRALGILLDVTDFDAIPGAVAKAEAAFGPIDVLVNNAGYGHEGIFEETTLEEMRRQFDANVFGAVAMMKAVLPGMRTRRSGTIVNVTSMGGFITMPGITAYCGSKFALEGISEVLGKEVKSVGVHVIALAPGQFRTDWAGRSMVRTGRSIAAYDAVIDPIRAARKEKSGKQPGDPAKAAEVLLQLVESDNPPTRLFLGADALKLVGEKIDAMQQEIAAWEDVSRSTDFD